MIFSLQNNWTHWYLDEDHFHQDLWELRNTWVKWYVHILGQSAGVTCIWRLSRCLGIYTFFLDPKGNSKMRYGFGRESWGGEGGVKYCHIGVKCAKTYLTILRFETNKDGQSFPCTYGDQTRVCIYLWERGSNIYYMCPLGGAKFFMLFGSKAVLWICWMVSISNM